MNTNIQNFSLSTIIILSILGIVLAFIAAFSPSLPIILLVILLTAIVSYQFPYFGLALNLNGSYLLTHLFALAEIENGILLSLRFILIVSLISIARQNDLKYPTEQRNNILIVLLGFIWLVFGVLYSDSTAFGSIKALRYLSFNATLFVIPLIIRWTQSTFISFLKSLAAIGAVAGWLSIIFIVYNGLNLSERVYLVQEVNVIWISRAMGISIIATLGLIFLKQKDHITLFLLLSLPGLLSSMLISGSRGPILALVIGLATIAIFMTKRKKSTITYLIVGFGLFMTVGMMALYLSSSSIRLLTDPTKLDSDMSALHRVIAWLKSIELIRNNIIIGIGTGGFQSVGNQLFPWLPRNSYAYPHNIFLEIFAENGLLGLLILFFPIFKITFWESQLNKLDDFKNQAIVLGLLVFALINAQVGGDLTMNEGIWYSVGILAALSVSIRNDDFYTLDSDTRTELPEKESSPK